MRRLSILMMLAVLAAIPGRAFADPAEPVIDATANITIKRLPTCETTIRTRVSEWKAAAAIACRKSTGSNVAACVDAQLKARADQLKRLRSCKFL